MVFALSALAPALDQVAHDGVYQPVAGHDVLELHRGGIGGLSQHKGALVPLGAVLEEGLDGVGPHVAVEGDAVGVKHGAGRPAYLGGPQPRLAVGGGGGADVAPFDVSDDKQALLLGVGDELLQDPHAPPAQHLKVGGLGLDGGHYVRQSVDEALVKFQHGLSGGLQGLPMPVHVLFEDERGNVLHPGVQPGHGWILFRLDLVLQYVE